LYTVTMLDHFQNPRNAGELPSPAVAVEVTNPACGDILRLSLSIEKAGVVETKIAEVRFKAKGCAPAIACGSMLTELIKGKTLREAARVSSADIVSGLGGLPPEGGHAAVLASDALKAALQQAREVLSREQAGSQQ
jgi:NifU-like protein involved in Fe-S cluster formation